MVVLPVIDTGCTRRHRMYTRSRCDLDRVALYGFRS